jgi:sulfite reductase alpha subunit-like flavoprotein
MQADKVYVQDRLRQSGEKVWQLLEAGAHFYVCGDAAHMATAVENALVDIISQFQVRGISPLALRIPLLSYSTLDSPQRGFP